ncbi:hypothetical protein [Pelomicrobium sp. G1]|uniref:hypothetical protein n=1 Tax=unclassified Pelomicrobium TaxID=2815318 RepID=UPI003F772CED
MGRAADVSWQRGRAQRASRGKNPEAFYEALVQRVIEAVEKSRIPRAQYGTMLIDEGHDFQPEWLQLVVQMVDPETNAFLLLYDDAQSIYHKGKRRNQPGGRRHSGPGAHHHSQARLPQHRGDPGGGLRIRPGRACAGRGGRGRHSPDGTFQRRTPRLASGARQAA